MAQPQRDNRHAVQQCAMNKQFATPFVAAGQGATQPIRCAK